MSEKRPAGRRVLIIGWDGGTWDVFRPLAEKGLMPRLKSLMDRGSFGVMTSTIPPVTPPAWTTLLTGINPERHGIFGFMEGLLFGETRRDVLARARPVSSLSFTNPSLLDILGRADKRMMCVNLPMSYPPRPVNGIMITGMLTPSDADNFTWPPELKQELGDYVIDVAHAPTLDEAARKKHEFDNATWVKRCTEIVGLRAQTVCRLGKTYPWDFGFVVFTGTDRIFHPLWPEIMDLIGKDSPTTGMEELLERFFVELDTALGALLDAFPDAVVMLTSDHGFGPRADHTVYPDVFLGEKGFLARRQGGPGRGLRQEVRRFVRRAAEALLPHRLTANLLRKASDRQTRLLASLDRECTVAYFSGLDAASYGSVKLLRETTAGLDNDERTRLVDEIMASLREMRDPRSGREILAGVYRREEVFPGAVVMVPSGTVFELTDEVFDRKPEFLPEIILEFRDGYTGRTDPLATQLVGPPPPDSHVGVHRTEGMFVLAGEPFKPAGEAPPMHLADVAPTVLHLTGLPVPADMQGEPPLALFTDEHLRAHPVQTEEAPAAGTEAPDETPHAYTPEQEKSVRDHLRRLGYLE